MPESSNHTLCRSTLPRVVIIGRPNVGKSSLFNRLIEKRVAIVDDQPGVTRDRLYQPTSWIGREFVMTDTGGFFGPDEDPLSPAVQEQIEEAVQAADVLCLVVDGRDGPIGLDHRTADQVRRLRHRKGATKKANVIVAVNKWDNTTLDYESPFYELGFPDVFPVSALHGHGTGNLLDEIVSRLPDPIVTTEEEAPETLAIAIVGRPNVGKSTLLNTLSGETRSLVSPIPGTTRDPVDTLIEWANPNGVTRRYRLVDTAGIRRRKKMSEGLDRYSLMRAKGAIVRADITLMMIDGSTGLTETDAKVFGLAHDAGRAAVILVNKWDDVNKDTATAGAMVKQIREEMPWLHYAEVQFVSALTGQRLQRILPCVERAVEQHRRRIPTAELNALLEEIVIRKPPPSRRGRISRIYYWTQVSVAPPTFVVFVNSPDRIHFSYRRFLVNRLYEAFGFTGTPLQIIVRARRSRDTPHDGQSGQTDSGHGKDDTFVEANGEPDSEERESWRESEEHRSYDDD